MDRPDFESFMLIFKAVLMEWFSLDEYPKELKDRVYAAKTLIALAENYYHDRGWD